MVQLPKKSYRSVPGCNVHIETSVFWKLLALEVFGTFRFSVKHDFFRPYKYFSKLCILHFGKWNYFTNNSIIIPSTIPSKNERSEATEISNIYHRAEFQRKMSIFFSSRRTRNYVYRTAQHSYELPCLCLSSCVSWHGGRQRLAQFPERDEIIETRWF